MTLSGITVSAAELAERLIPVLNTSIVQKMASAEAYAEELLSTCKKFVEPLFPLSDQEAEFIHRLRHDGKIDARLLTDDPVLIERMTQDPSLLWRASKAGS